MKLMYYLFRCFFYSLNSTFVYEVLSVEMQAFCTQAIEFSEHVKPIWPLNKKDTTPHPPPRLEYSAAYG